MDLRRSDLALLVSLDALLEARGVTSAARRLGISQPALSAHLARLRDIFDDDLLVGNAHGMALTPRAEAIREPLHTLLSELGTLVAEGVGFDPARDARTLRLAASDLTHAFILPPLRAALAERAPNVTIEAVPLVVDHLPEAMKGGAIDMAVTSLENAPPTFPARRLRREPSRLIWRKGHPAELPPATPAALCTLDHLVVSIEGAGILGDVDEVLRGLGLTRRIVGSVPNFLVASHVVRRTDCVAVVPGILAGIDGAGIESGPLPIEMAPLEIYLSWHPRARGDAAHRWLRELIIEISQSAP